MNKVIGTQHDQYGPLQPGLSFELKDGYQVLVGANNSGKSSVLQLIYKKLTHDIMEFGPEKILLLLPHRGFIDLTFQPGARSLSNFNDELAANINSAPMYNNIHGNPNTEEITRLILQHTNAIDQLTELNTYLPKFGLPLFKISGSQNISFQDVAVPFQGSGLRAILPILAALTDSKLELIMVDEPETALEPRLQKILRDIFLEYTARTGKSILVSTHSHLFLNRETVVNNNSVRQINNRNVTITQISTEKELSEITFQLLGNSLEDLFFPSNFLIVEGSSDQEIVTKVISLLGAKNRNIKVFSAGSIDQTGNTYQAIVNSLKPLVVSDSPYYKKVVCLTDKPNQSSKARIDELKKTLGKRLITLDQPSIEEYVPDSVYTRIGKVKSQEILAIEHLKNDFVKQMEYKKNLSIKIAESLQQADLSNLPKIVKAVQIAIDKI